MPAADELSLNEEQLRALSSETRRTMLRAIAEKPRTVTDLAKRLDLSKSTVHEHLGKLIDAELVYKEAYPERKRVLYAPTDIARRYTRQGSMRRILLPLSVGFIGLASVAEFARYLFLRMQQSGGYAVSDSGAGIQATEEAARSAQTGASSAEIHLIIGVVLFVITLTLGWRCWRQLRTSQ